MTDPMELVERLDDCAAANRGLGRDGLATLISEAAACIRDLVECGLPAISKDGPVKIGRHRVWLARQLLDSNLEDDEAYGIVRHHPALGPPSKADRGGA